MKNLSYELVSKNPSDLRRLTGLSIEEFQMISAKAQPLWDKKIVTPKKVSGRPWATGGLENHILALLIYYRFYVPHTLRWDEDFANLDIRYQPKCGIFQELVSLVYEFQSHVEHLDVALKCQQLHPHR